MSNAAPIRVMRAQLLLTSDTQQACRSGVVLKVSKRKQKMLKKKHAESFYSLHTQ
jgi:hypothetical protein